MLCKGGAGKLGQESFMDYWYPPPEPIRLNADFEPIDIVTGFDHTCSLSVDGRVACWGYVRCVHIYYTMDTW